MALPAAAIWYASPSHDIRSHNRSHTLGLDQPPRNLRTNDGQQHDPLHHVRLLRARLRLHNVLRHVHLRRRHTMGIPHRPARRERHRPRLPEHVQAVRRGLSHTLQERHPDRLGRDEHPYQQAECDGGAEGCRVLCPDVWEESMGQRVCVRE